MRKVIRLSVAGILAIFSVGVIWWCVNPINHPVFIVKKAVILQGDDSLSTVVGYCMSTSLTIDLLPALDFQMRAERHKRLDQYLHHEAISPYLKQRSFSQKEIRDI